MPNPNIAALAELTTGTLAWTMTADQVTFHGGRSTADDSSSSALNVDIPTGTNYIQTDKSSIALANKMVVAMGMIYDGNGNRTYSSVTQNGDAMTHLFHSGETNEAMKAHGSADRISMHYRTNPDTHATNELRVAWTPSATAEIMMGMAGYFSNVDQTEPFTKIYRDQRYWGEQNYGFRGPADPINIKTKPGDLCLVWGWTTYRGRFIPRNRDSHTIGAMLSSNESNSKTQSGYFGFFSPSSYEEPFLLEKVQSYQGHSGAISSGATSTTHLFGAANIQSPTTPKTLFTVPANMAVKINSIQIGNPEVPGMYVDLAVTGLPAGTNSIQNASSADVLTVASDPGVVTTTPIARRVKARMQSRENILHQPIWLQAADSLTAKVVCDQNLPEFENRNLDIIISFETVKD